MLECIAEDLFFNILKFSQNIKEGIKGHTLKHHYGFCPLMWIRDLIESWSKRKKYIKKKEYHDDITNVSYLIRENLLMQ